MQNLFLQNKYYCAFLCVVLFFQFQAHAQNINVSSDLSLIHEKKISKSNTKKVYHYALQNQSLATKLNPVNIGYASLMYVYENTLMHHVTDYCVFNPINSEFSKQAVVEYGFIKGVLLSVDRINKDTRIGRAGMNTLYLDEKTGKINDPISKYKFQQ